MGLLVDDLLLLARLDQQRPLEKAPVDVGGVAGGRRAVGAAAPDRAVEVAVDGVGPGGGGRRARLHQVVANLLDNALAYSRRRRR